MLDLAADLARTSLPWQRLSAGAGAKGHHRYYSRARPPIEPEAGSAGHHWLLIRRNDTTGELAYYRCYHHSVPLGDLVAVARQRWRIEENFQAGKGHVGLDQHQVRHWNSWHRCTTPGMIAHAPLTVLTATIRHTLERAPLGSVICGWGSSGWPI